MLVTAAAPPAPRPQLSASASWTTRLSQAEVPAGGDGQGLHGPDVVLDEDPELAVWAAMRSSATPAAAAVVAYPARREWPVMWAAASPASAARRVTIRPGRS